MGDRAEVLAMGRPAVTLRPVGLHWISEPAVGEERDLCAHGRVEFRIGDDRLMDPADGKDWTVSAAALYLLRTLTHAHTHEPRGEAVVIRTRDGRQWQVAHAERRDAVLGFADAVSDFFAHSRPKAHGPDPDVAEGFAAFATEWERRRGKPLGAAGA